MLSRIAAGHFHLIYINHHESIGHHLGSALRFGETLSRSKFQIEFVQIVNAVEKNVKTEGNPRRQRGVSVGGKVRSRSRSDEGTKKDDGFADHSARRHAQLLQAQVNQLTGRLGSLETAHRPGQEAISSFVARLVDENAKLDVRPVGLQAAT